MGTKATQGKIQHLFDLFAQNWTLVKQHPNLHVTPDIPDSFLCPVCFKGFTRDVLATPDFLTLEHVPPKKLGGINKDCTLTCRVCNNTTGILEGRLKEQLVAKEALAGLEGTSIDGEYCAVVEGQEIWRITNWSIRIG